MLENTKPHVLNYTIIILMILLTNESQRNAEEHNIFHDYTLNKI